MGVQQHLRVLVASEHSEVRHVLQGILQRDGGAVIVGQGEDTSRALTLARNLRPDVAVIDYHLPHAVGLDDIRLSRMGGLDTAQAIVQEIPGTRVMLVTDPETEFLPQRCLAPGAACFFSKEEAGSITLLKLDRLGQESTEPDGPIFVGIRVDRAEVIGRRLSEIGDKGVLFGGFTALTGLFSMLTIVLAPAGVALVIAGAAAMLVGLGAKLAVRLQHRLGRRK